jgi:GAF domain-containing protein
VSEPLSKSRTPTEADVAATLSRTRPESDTLYGLIRAVVSSPDLDQALAAVMSVLNKATQCHACVLYLRSGGRLRLRAASPIYAHLVGKIEFGDDEGLAGWVVQRNTPAFIREDALADPRNKFVPELEEERFQSILAMPIPSRAGDVMGAIGLHTVAPREFDEQTLTLLAHAAPLVAGVVENAQLYEDARRRVGALTALTELSQRIAAVEDRPDLYRAATEGVRTLLGCDAARLYERDAERGRMRLVATDPPSAQAADATPHPVELRASVAAGDEQLGELVVASSDRLPAEAEELLRAVANQIALALKRAELIERLTEESVVRDLFTVLEQERLEDAETRARRVRCDLDRGHVFVQLAAAPDASRDAPLRTEHVEASLRRLVPGALCSGGSHGVRALLPLGGGGTSDELKALDAALARLGAEDGIAIGRSDLHHGAAEGRSGLREAADAACVAAALRSGGGALAYGELGAYRYLVPLATEDVPPDPFLTAVHTLADYDRRRGSQLVATLEQYLADRRSVTETARTLIVHPNTLRQRLERIETLTGLDLATADLLALELAVKLARLRPAQAS